MTQEEISTHLKAHGWVKYSSIGNEIWCKRYPGPRCTCNINKEGIQIVINVYHRDQFSYEIELCAEKPDNKWISFKVYGIGSDLLTALDEQVRQLLRAWETMHVQALYKPDL